MAIGIDSRGVFRNRLVVAAIMTVALTSAVPASADEDTLAWKDCPESMLAAVGAYFEGSCTISNLTAGSIGNRVAISTASPEEVTTAVTPSLIPATPYGEEFDVEFLGIVPLDTLPGTYRMELLAEGIDTNLAVETIEIEVVPQILRRIEVQPSRVSLALGQTQQFTAVGYDPFGNPVEIGQVTWSADGGTFTGDGLYEATIGGAHTATASLNGATGTAAITVIDPPARLEVHPLDVDLRVGLAHQFQASVVYSDGTSEPAAGATWSATAGAIDPATGRYEATTAGSHEVVAVIDAFSGEAELPADLVATLEFEVDPVTIEIVPADPMLGPTDTLQLTLDARVIDGPPFDLADVSWWASAGEVGADGLYTAPEESGTYTITATAGAATATTLLRVVTEDSSGWLWFPIWLWAVLGLAAAIGLVLLGRATA